MKQSIILKLIVSSVAFSLLCACNSENEKAPESNSQEESKLESAMAELQNKYEELRQAKPSAAFDWASEDLKNIGDWEYKIIELSGLSATELEDELNALGEERWQVFWVKENSNDKMQIMLKRPTVSYLSKLPLSSLGKMMMNGEGQ